MTLTLSESRADALIRAASERSRGEISSAIQWENIAHAYGALMRLEHRKEPK